MTNQIYPYDIAGNYTFDSDKINVSSGLVTLKENLSDVYARWHMNEDTGDTVLDSSGNGRDGTPINNPVSVAGKINNALLFNGTTQYIDFGNIANFERTQAFSVVVWVELTMTSAAHFVNHIQSGSPFTGWQFYKHTDQKLNFSLINNAGSNIIQVGGSTSINTGSFKLAIMTYDGSSTAAGVKFYVDNVAETMNIITDTLSSSTLFTTSLNIGRRSDGVGHVNGKEDEISIYSRVLTAAERSYIWNSGAGRENFINFSDNPTIEPTDLLDPATVSSWDVFSETLGGGNQGAVGYNLYKVDKADKYYWNGSAWVTGGSPSNVNTAAVINTNIGTFDGSPDKIGFLAYLISDGTQQVELDENVITFTINQNPLVSAGIDKNVFDNLFIAPFSDATFSDTDGTVDVAEYQVVGEVDIWTDIPQGAFATLLEAVQAFMYQFTNTGVVIVKLRVTDNEGGMSEDSLLMTVKKYTVTFNVKDVQGNHLAGFRFNAGDGSIWSDQDSPFTYDYDFSVTDLVANIDHHSYVLAAVTVPTTVHNEDITLEFTNAIEIRRILGMMQENYRLFNVVYTSGQLTSATIRLYPTAADVATDTNHFEEYLMTAAYNISDQIVDYQVVRV